MGWSWNKERRERGQRSALAPLPCSEGWFGAGLGEPRRPRLPRSTTLGRRRTLSGGCRTHFPLPSGLERAGPSAESRGRGRGGRERRLWERGGTRGSQAQAGLSLEGGLRAEAQHRGTCQALGTAATLSLARDQSPQPQPPSETGVGTGPKPPGLSACTRKSWARGQAGPRRLPSPGKEERNLGSGTCC